MATRKTKPRTKATTKSTNKPATGGGPARATRETRPSNPAQVDDYLRALDHPLLPLVQATRAVVLAASKSIGEEIKWNAPSFYFTGAMPPTDPKLYARHLVNFNLYKRDCLRLIFLRAGGLRDPTGLLTGDYADGRRLVLLHDLAELKTKERALQSVLKQQLQRIPR